MTTDTLAEAVSRQVKIDGHTITLSGISKGAGMIRPNMATMLGFLAFDAKVAQPVLAETVKYVADRSFNCITIDGDTSTNDSFILIASGKASLPKVTSTDSPTYTTLCDTVTEIAQELAQLIVRDGEGATKFMTVTVEGGKDVAECRQIAYTIGHSRLVKTAFYVSDLNLGRILATIGYAGRDEPRCRQDRSVSGRCARRKGGRPQSRVQGEDGQRVMKKSEILIRVLLSRGKAAATVWTCDLSHDYVSINADYRS